MGILVKGRTTFINPYNFVSVEWDKTDREDVRNTIGNLSGVIKCRLHVVTPVSLPDTEQVKEDANKHKTYPFMRAPDGKLMIPGSSLRGAIRSVYETVTDSCFVTSKETQIITKRAMPKDCGEPYLLYKTDDGWELHKAERYLIIINDKDYIKLNNPEFENYPKWSREDLNNHRYGEMISFTPGRVYHSQKHDRDIGRVVSSFTGTTTGYLYKGEVPPTNSETEKEYHKGKKIPNKKGEIKSNKHFESIFVERRNKKPIVVSQDQVNALKDIYEKYNDSGVNRLKTKDSTLYEGVLDLLNQPTQPIPVWYNTGNEQLSLASIGRIAYRNRMGNMLREKSPCNNRTGLCRACQLFGTANGDGKVGSRLRITDAVASDGTNVIENVTLKELGSPHISFEKFYIEGNSYDDTEGRLRGRKYYWHNLKEKVYEVDPELENEGKTERNATMELVDRGSEFTFDVFFNQITPDQLKELKWVLTLGQNISTSSKCYKIGRGKPIGLGSVKISIDSIQKREFDISTGNYNIMPEKTEMTMKLPETFKSDKVDDVLTIMDTESTRGKHISYPYIENARKNDNSTAPHKWFSELKNRNSDNKQEWKSIEEALENPFYALISKEKSYLPRDKSKKQEYTKWQKYKGKVIGDNGKGSVLKVELEIGGMAFVYFKDIKEKYVSYGAVLIEYPIDTEVFVTYEGIKIVNDKPKESWSIK